jgi:hypothetical protein
MLTMEILFWLSIVMMGYAYVGYPLALRALVQTVVARASKT